MNKVEFLSVTMVPFAARYDNFIGGKFVAPISGRYFDNASPVNGQIVCKIARSDQQDIEAALDRLVGIGQEEHRRTLLEELLELSEIERQILRVNNLLQLKLEDLRVYLVHGIRRRHYTDQITRFGYDLVEGLEGTVDT